MRTSGKGNEVVMILVPVVLLVVFGTWFAGGPTAAMKVVESFVNDLTGVVGAWL